ncbi:MAG: signal peptide peptidase SppA [Planctomycetota bacterium]
MNELENNAGQNQGVKRRRSVSFWIALILGVFLLLSLLVNFVQCISVISLPSGKNKDAAKPYTEKFVTGEQESENKILIISVKGVILNNEGDSGFFGATNESINERISRSLKQVQQDKNIKAILLRVDSPGGGITECDQIYQSIKRFKQSNPQIPIVALMDDMAASGGYYISAMADKIIAHPTTLTGSIGVIAQFINIEGLFSKLGLKDIVIKSGVMKDIGSSTRAMTEEEKALLQGIIDEMYGRFVQVITEGRKNLSREQILKLADGRIYTGEQAVKNGLVDEIGYLEDAIKSTETLAKISKAKIIEYEKSKGFIDFMFGALSPKFQPEMNLTRELKSFIYSSNTPRLLYLWKGRTD